MEKISPLHLSSYSAGRKFVYATQWRGGAGQSCQFFFTYQYFIRKGTEGVVARTRMMEERKIRAD